MRLLKELWPKDRIEAPGAMQVIDKALEDESSSARPFWMISSIS